MTKKRAHIARCVLNYYRNGVITRPTDYPLEDLYVDLLTDLRHFATLNDIKIKTAWKRSKEHFKAERGSEREFGESP